MCVRYSVNAIFIIVISLLCLISIELAYFAWKLKITPTPSVRIARDLINVLVTRHIPSEQHPQCTVHELGSGWGGLAYTLYRSTDQSTSKCKVRGYELAFTPFWFSRVLYQRSPRLTFHQRDLTTAIESAESGDVLVCYLCPEQMQRLSDTLDSKYGTKHTNDGDACDTDIKKEQIQVGLTLISLTFALPRFEPTESYTLPTLYRDPVYLYKL